MHTVAVQLAPVLAAEKSKVPFYIAGGLLVVWALVLALVLGMRKPEFPGGLAGQRLVSAISAVLVLGATSTAVLTAGGTAESAPSSSTTSTGAQAPAATSATPTTQAPSAATTGAPAPTTSTPTTTAAAPPPRTVSRLSLAADPGGQLLYNTKTLSAKAGSVTLSLTNSSPVEHNVTIVKGLTVLGATPTFKNGARSVSLRLPPGTYTFYCSVPGHRQAGMEGTLSVS